MLNRIERFLRARSLFALVLFALLAVGLVSACGAAAPAPTSAPALQRLQDKAGNAPAAQPTSAPVAAAAQPTSAPAATAAPSNQSGGFTPGQPSNALPIDRKIIKNGQLTMIVDSADTALARVTGIASDVGGYVVGSHTFAEGSSTGAQITIAVPVDRFEEAVNLVRKVAQHIDSDVTTSSDVTEQYVDLQSRQKNLEATADRIRSFLEKAATVDEALKINQQLSQVEDQIEQIKGKLNAMNARTSFSTITVDMHEPKPSPTPTATPTATPTPTPIGWHPDQTFNSAMTVQTSLLRTLGDLAIWLIVVLLPYVLFFGVIAWIAAWVIKRFIKPRATTTTLPTKAPGE